MSDPNTAGSGGGPVDLHTDQPHPARVYDYPTLQVRSHAEIERSFDGLDLLEPGLRSLPDWRPDSEREATDAQVSVYGGVARKR